MDRPVHHRRPPSVLTDAMTRQARARASRALRSLSLSRQGGGGRSGCASSQSLFICELGVFVAGGGKGLYIPSSLEEGFPVPNKPYGFCGPCLLLLGGFVSRFGLAVRR